MDTVRGPLPRVALVTGAVSFVAVLVFGGLIGERSGNATPGTATPVLPTQSPTTVEPTIETSVPEDSGSRDTSTTSTPTTSTGPTTKKKQSGSVDAPVTLTVKIRAQDSKGKTIRLENFDGLDVTVPQDSPNGSTPTTVMTTVTPSGEVVATVQAPANQPTQVCISVTRPNWQFPTGGDVNSGWIAQPDRGSCRTVTEPNGRTIDAVVVRS